MDEESVPPPYPKNILEDEVREATKALGIPEERLIIFRYKVRHFAHHRQEILEDLVKLSTDLNPNLVFMPTLRDIHQDHTTIAMEGLRAFKKTTILCYELPWNNLTFTSNIHVVLSERDLENKGKAITCYKSQENRSYMSQSFFEGLARVRGTQVGSVYAEAFEAIRWIL